MERKVTSTTTVILLLLSYVALHTCAARMVKQDGHYPWAMIATPFWLDIHLIRIDNPLLELLGWIKIAIVICAASTIGQIMEQKHKVAENIANAVSFITPHLPLTINQSAVITHASHHENTMTFMIDTTQIQDITDNQARHKDVAATLCEGNVFREILLWGGSIEIQYATSRPSTISLTCP